MAQRATTLRSHTTGTGETTGRGHSADAACGGPPEAIDSDRSKGGRVLLPGRTYSGVKEIGQLHSIPFRLRVDVRDLTIHGREAADQIPYLHVDRLQAEIKIISFLSTEVGLHSLLIEHPVIHIIVYPDGSTNQPSPAVSGS